MGEPLGFRRDLFQGTAEYYDRFRAPYPVELVDALRARAGVRRAARVLDLACGTGQVAFALAPHVAEVVAVDQEAEAIEMGARRAARLGVSNIDWIASDAEDVDLPGSFDLVTIGNAFHRLDREAIATKVAGLLRAGGCVALLWGGTPWDGELPWQVALSATLAQWRSTVEAARGRVPEGWEETIARDPHAEVLRRAGFVDEGVIEVSVVHRWSVESLIGFMYSTSFLNRTVLGDRAAAFEGDLRGRLLACHSDGVFEQELAWACELARRGLGGRTD